MTSTNKHKISANLLLVSSQLKESGLKSLHDYVNYKLQDFGRAHKQNNYTITGYNSNTGVKHNRAIRKIITLITLQYQKK